MFEDRIRSGSYTVFVLPFAYRPEAGDGGKPEDPAWRPLEFDRGLAPDRLEERSAVWRAGYFIPETNLVLYNRAKWLELANPSWDAEQWCIPKGVHPCRLQIDWTRLVLFEWPGADPSASQRGGQDTCMHNGMLLIKVSFPEGGTLSHQLWLNECFRYDRMPYWSHPTKDFDRAEILPGLVKTSGKEGACSYRDPWKGLLSHPVRLPGASPFRLFSQAWGLEADRQAFVPPPGTGQPLATWDQVQPPAGSSWDVFPDNRAFVWTCARLESKESTLPDLDSDESPEFPANFAQDPGLVRWFNLLDVDRSVSSLQPFHHRWLKDRTYTRWAPETLYGFNNYSAAMMTTSDWDPPPWHFETMYLDMGLLMLHVRTTLFRFSSRIGKLTARHRDGKNDDTWLQEFRALREDFAEFTNLYQFPLLSTQQQAVEMYTLLREQMDVDCLFREVESEIRATHEFAEMQSQNRLNVGVQTLTVGGIGLAVAALVAQAFSMEDRNLLSLDVGQVIQTAVALVLGFGGGLLATWFTRRRDRASKNTKGEG